ncbi:MAG: adenosylcobinamide-GDP ribazoletransferase [Polyangiales bacterium]
MDGFVRGLRGALSFLTRIPIHGELPKDDEWDRSLALFPLVGLGIGGLMAAVYALSFRAGPLVASTLALSVGLLLTGAMHEDGLADTADALGGGRDAEGIRAILKDPRLGSFGVSALVAVLLLRVALVASFGEAGWYLLLLSQSAGRFAPLVLMSRLPYAGSLEASKSAFLPRPSDSARLVGAAVPAFVLGLGVVFHLVAPAAAALGLGAYAVVTWTALARFRTRLGGYTGDFLGAVEQLAECALLVGVAVVGPPSA